MIGSSMADARPVFDKIAQSCGQLFASEQVGVFLLGDDGLLHAGAWYGAAMEAVVRTFPKPLEQTITARVLRERAPVHIADAAALKDAPASLREVQTLIGNFSAVWVPMLWEARGVGSICLLRQPVKPFSEKELALLKTFADQAVIAVQNARLFNETKEALDQQTATAEILKIISRSPTDVQPVLDAVAESAGRLCHAEGSRVWLVEGDRLRAMTSYGPGYAGPNGETLPIRRTSVGGRAVVERQCIHVIDVVPLLDTEYPDIRELQGRHGFRTVLNVPLLRDGVAVGVISMLRTEVRAFSPAEIGLVQTFADQAVIAIQNVRLFRQTQEALERQTATADILKVISSSPTDVQPVFDAIVEAALRLLPSAFTAVLRRDGEGYRLVALANRDEAQRRRRLDDHPPLVPIDAAHNFPSRVFVEQGDAAHSRLDGDRPAAARAPGLRGHGAPLVADAAARLRRRMRRRSRDRTYEAARVRQEEIALAQSFVDQAVIAIQNVRLFNETQEALERQTATAEVLKVISESPTDCSRCSTRFAIARWRSPAPASAA